MMLTTVRLRGTILPCGLHLLFCCSNVAFPQSPARGSGTLAVDVRDAVEGARIDNAFVLVHHVENGRDTTVTLTAAEDFSASLAPGVYDVFVAASAFAPTCKAVAIMPGQVSRFAAHLRADEEHLESSSN